MLNIRSISVLCMLTMLLTCSQSFAGSSDTPIRPMSGSIALGFGKTVSWSSKPHNGIDYSGSLNTWVKSVGKGTIHSYTKTTASRFGSINPDGAGPAVWLKYVQSSGAPIYVLLGHNAWSWDDRSGKGKSGRFSFNCQYQIYWRPGQTVKPGELLNFIAPFYNGGRLQTHLHVSVFKPYRNGSGYYGPPTSGWGYSDLKLSTGEYINPETFFTTYKLNNN